MGSKKLGDTPVIFINTITGRGTGYLTEYFALFHAETGEQIPIPDYDHDYFKVHYDEASNTLDMSAFRKDQLDKKCKYLPEEKREWETERILSFRIDKEKLLIRISYGWPVGYVDLYYAYANEAFELDKVLVNYNG